MIPLHNNVFAALCDEDYETNTKQKVTHATQVTPLDDVQDELIYDNSMLLKAIKAKVKKLCPKGNYGFLKSEAFPNNIFFHANDLCIPYDSLSVKQTVFVIVVKETHNGLSGLYGRCISNDLKTTTAAFCKYMEKVETKSAHAMNAEHAVHLEEVSQVSQVSPVKQVDVEVYKISNRGTLLNVNIQKQKALIIDIDTEKEYTIVPLDMHSSLRFADLQKGMKVEFQVDDDGYVSNVKQCTLLSLEEIENEEKDVVFFLNEQADTLDSNYVECKRFDTVCLPRDKPYLFSRLIEIYVTGFLNAGIGGALLFGIDDDGTVTGTSIDTNKRQHIEDVMANVIETLEGCSPPILANMYEVKFHSIYERLSPDAFKKVEDRWVIGVYTNRPTTFEIYETSAKYNKQGKVAWIRKDGANIVMDLRMIVQRARSYYGRS